MCEFKYLGHIVIVGHWHMMTTLCVKFVIFFIRTNILICRFSKCPLAVKIQLFKSYCVCLYDTALWKYFNISRLNELKSAYNKCINLFFGYRRCYSGRARMQMLLKHGLPIIVNTILVNGLTVFTNLQVNYANTLIARIASLQL